LTAPPKWLRFPPRAEARGLHRNSDEFSHIERDAKLSALADEFASEGTTWQGLLNMIGQAAQREGKSFDESLEAYFFLYVENKGIYART
jgi:hypothetical protein